MIDNSMFYMNFETEDEMQVDFINSVKRIGFDGMSPLYLLKKPIIEKKADYDYQDGIVILMPKHKLIFVNFGNECDEFNEFQDDFIDDIGYIAKKYDFIKIVGRPRQWREGYVSRVQYQRGISIIELLKENELNSDEKMRMADILISLATGSINEAERLGADVPNNILDQIKRKIILFDGEQTKFIFDEPLKKRITIQGLAKQFLSQKWESHNIVNGFQITTLSAGTAKWTLQ